ncbi:iron complex transport system substrate-binding protein [Lachnospiraceae bacterium XBD2001]|nr:iron complex transport system substrate-binding protein [Lachnospiraceae bacterium XBD2001]
MRKTGILGCVLALMILCFAGCTQQHTDTVTEPSGISWNSLESSGNLTLSYATGFSVEDYGSDYSLITIPQSGRYLVVAENAALPDDLPEDVVVLQQPLQHIYNASSSTMDLFRVLNGLDAVSMTGTKSEDWSIPEIAELVKSEEIVYAGKYSNPDYEYLIEDGCSLAIENTMIYHSPEVLETMEKVGIPTLVERSSYEEDPLGRLEWVKLYGVLLDKREEADAYFSNEVARLQKVLPKEMTEDGPSVVYFYLNANGGVNVRKPGDYISKMIRMAGGSYAFPKIAEEDDNSTSMTMQMEAFYAYAKDADVLIYNGSINGVPQSLEELIASEPLLLDFKAVKNHKVYCADGDMFQQVSGTCDMILDFYHVLQDEEDGDGTLTYLYQLQ